MESATLHCWYNYIYLFVCLIHTADIVWFYRGVASGSAVPPKPATSPKPPPAAQKTAGGGAAHEAAAKNRFILDDMVSGFYTMGCVYSIPQGITLEFPDIFSQLQNIRFLTEPVWEFQSISALWEYCWHALYVYSSIVGLICAARVLDWQVQSGLPLGT